MTKFKSGREGKYYFKFVEVPRVLGRVGSGRRVGKDSKCYEMGITGKVMRNLWVEIDRGPRSRISGGMGLKR